MAPDVAGGIQHCGAVAAGRMGDELARMQGAGLDEAGHESGQDVVGDGEQDEVGILSYFRRGPDGHTGQQRLGPKT